MRKLALYRVLVASLLLLAGCGGSGGGTVEPPPPPASTITSVTVAAASSSVQIGQTVQCTPTVTGTGTFSTAVTWTATGGATVSSTGLVTAPQTAGSVTVTATSVQDATKKGSVTITVTLPPAPTVTLTASKTTITLGDSTTLTWATTNATSVTTSWSGTTSTSGSEIVTPIATGSITYTIQATGLGGTASANVMVQVNPVPRTITSLALPWLYCDGACGIVGFPVYGTGFALSDIFHAAAGTAGILGGVSYVNSTQVNVQLIEGSDNTSPGWQDYKDCDSADTNCSNQKSQALIGNQNLFVLLSDGRGFAYDPAQGLPHGQNGYMRRFTAGMSLDASYFVGTGGASLAYDEATQNIVLCGIGSVGVADLDMNIVGGASTGNYRCVGVAASSGISCSTQNLGNTLGCFPTTAVNAVMTFVSTPADPFSIAMGKLGTQVVAVVYSREAGVLSAYGVTNSSGTIGINLIASLALTGITPASQLAGTGKGGWQVAIFSSGPAAGKGAFLSAADNKVIIFDVATMTQVGNPITLSGVPFRIAADETHGNLIVANADSDARLTRYDSIALATGTVTRLHSTSTLLSVGFAVSADGTKLYSASRDAAEALPNQ